MQQGVILRRSSDAASPLRKVSSTSINSPSTNITPAPLSFSSSKSFPTPTKNKQPKTPKKVNLNRFHLKGLACLQDQEAVKRWIEDVLGIKMKKDFASSLSNGVLLCQLMNKIREDSIPNIHLAKSQAYLSLENINFFLSVCLEMGIGFNDVFNPADLYEKRNIPKVVKCLLLVGSIATKLGFQPPLAYTPREEQISDQGSDLDAAEVIEVNRESNLTEQNVEENNTHYNNEENGEDTLDGLSFEELERAISFPDLDRTITEADKGDHGDSWMDVSSGGSDSDSASLELHEWRDKVNSPLKITEYTIDELKIEYPLIEEDLFLDLERIEDLGRSALSNNNAPQVAVRKYHYKGIPKDPTDNALADYINFKFARDVPPNVSLPNPISRLGKDKYLFEDRVMNLKLTNGIILVRVGGGWMKLREVLVRLSSMAACEALREKGGPSKVKTNISEWKDQSNRNQSPTSLSPIHSPTSPKSPTSKTPPPISTSPIPPTTPLKKTSSTNSPITPLRKSSSSIPSITPLKQNSTTSSTPLKKSITIPSMHLKDLTAPVADPLPSSESPKPLPESPKPLPPNPPTDSTPTTETPPPSPKKPLPKIPPLKLPTKTSKPLLPTKAPTLQLFTAAPPPIKKRSMSLPRNLTPEPKPKIATQTSLPTLPIKKSLSASATPTPSAPHTPSSQRTSLAITRSLSLTSVHSPRDSEPSSQQQPNTPRRSASSDTISASSSSIPSPDNSLNSPTTPNSAKISKNSNPATPRYDPAPSPTSAPAPSGSPSSNPPDSPFRSPRVSLSTPKLATLKGKT